MSLNTIPISLTPVVPPTGITATNFTQLLQNICQYIKATIQADVSFYSTFASPPAAFSGNLIYVVNLGNFMVWHTSSGSYQTLNQLSLGAVIQQAVIYAAPSYDDFLNGFVYLNGRIISTITGLSGAQVAVLNSLFPNGILANIQPLQVFPVGQMAAVGTIAAGTGFVDGETVTQAVSGATGKVYQFQGPGSTNLVILNYTGTANATNIWTGGTSGTQFTPDGIHTVIPYYGPELVISRVYCGTNIPAV